MKHTPLPSLAEQALARCDLLATFSESPTQLTRTFLSPPMREVHNTITQWMQAAGMTVRIDGVGNIIGRLSCTTPNAKTLLFGSHLDTVPNAGKFDGILGVLLGLATVEALQGARLPFHLEVVGFSEEEGVRFGFPYIGSRGFTGYLDPTDLQVPDRRGVTAAQALRDFGIEPHYELIDPNRYIAYFESHIEQGPVLDKLHLPLGIVSSIVGQRRILVRINGRAAHAGTTPMDQRQDALLCAAWCISKIGKYARTVDALVATVGSITATPNVPNVVAGQVEFTVDIRHADDKKLDRARFSISKLCEQLAPVHGCVAKSSFVSSKKAEAMSAQLIDRLSQVINGQGIRPFVLPSGAGHDAAVIAPHIPSAMLFIRSPGGVSHHPDESVLPDDVEKALDVMVRFVESLASDYNGATPQEGR